MYVIGGRLLVHCTKGNCSLEVPLSIQRFTCTHLTAREEKPSIEEEGSDGPGMMDGDRSFSSLSDCVSDKTLKAISEMGFTEMMEIQYRSIRPLLEGK